MGSIKTTIDKQNNLIIQIVEGDICLDDIVKVIESSLNNKSYTEGMDAVWDISAATITDVQAGDVFGLINFLVKNIIRIGIGFKLAIIVNSDLGFGLAKMFIGYGQILPFSKCVFRSYEEGIAWINGSQLNVGETPRSINNKEVKFSKKKTDSNLLREFRS